MKFEKEVKIIRVYSESNIVGNDYTLIKLDGALSHKDFKNISNNFTDEKIKLTLEVEEPILDEEERKYLSGVIRPFRDRVDYIEKNDSASKEYISIHLKNSYEYVTLPFFKAGTMYKNMELNKEYTLKDLGL